MGWPWRNHHANAPGTSIRSRSRKNECLARRGPCRPAGTVSFSLGLSRAKDQGAEGKGVFFWEQVPQLTQLSPPHSYIWASGWHAGQVLWRVGMGAWFLCSVSIGVPSKHQYRLRRT